MLKGKRVKEIMRFFVGTAAVIVCASFFPQPALPQQLTQHKASHKIVVNGDIRNYYFTRSYKEGTDQAAFSVGGRLHAETSARRGLGFGATYMGANPLAQNGPNPLLIDNTLPGYTISTLGEAYLSYQGERSQVKYGRQVIRTPWANPSDTRMVPVSFEGLSASMQTTTGWSFSLDRMYKFKNRVKSTFDRNTLVTTVPTSGFLAAGTVYKKGPLSAQAWYYRFYDIAQLGYADALLRANTKKRFKPVAAAQIMSEGGIGGNLLKNVRAHAAGGSLGVASDDVEATVSYDNVPGDASAYKGGLIVSPYTSGYQTDPLFTDTQSASLVEKGQGHAYKVAATFWTSGHRFRFIADRARYFLAPAKGVPNNDLLKTDFDLTYFLGARPGDAAFRGLAIRDKLGIFDTPAAPLTQQFNQAMLEYDF